MSLNELLEELDKALEHVDVIRDKIKNEAFWVEFDDDEEEEIAENNKTRVALIPKTTEEQIEDHLFIKERIEDLTNNWSFTRKDIADFVNNSPLWLQRGSKTKRYEDISTATISNVKGWTVDRERSDGKGYDFQLRYHKAKTLIKILNNIPYSLLKELATSQ